MKYQVIWREARIADIEADNEADARKKWMYAEFEDDTFCEKYDPEIVSVTEIAES